MSAFCYVLYWFVLFASPLLLIFGALVLSVRLLTDSHLALSTVLIVTMPFSLAFLGWQMATFIGPAYFSLIRRVVFSSQRVHKMKYAEAMNLVRKQRLHALSTLPRSLRRGPFR